MQAYVHHASGESKGTALDRFVKPCLGLFLIGLLLGLSGAALRDVVGGPSIILGWGLPFVLMMLVISSVIGEVREPDEVAKTERTLRSVVYLISAFAGSWTGYLLSG